MALSAPRQAGRTKQRSTAPPKSLGNSLNKYNAKPQKTEKTTNDTKKKKNEDDLLGFLDNFDMNGDNNTKTNDESNNDNPFANNTESNNNTGNNDDPFDIFNMGDDDKKSKDDEIKKLHPNLAVNSKKFDKRSSHAVPDPNFDLSMWDDPFGSHDQDNDAKSKERTQKAYSTTQIKTQKKSPFAQSNLKSVKESKNDDENEDDDEDEEDEDDDEDDEDEDEDDTNDKTNKKNLKAVKKNTEKRKSAPIKKIENDSKKVKNTNALEELHRGAALLKYPRRSGFPHFKHIQLSLDNTRIQWFSKRKSLDETCVLIKDIKEVVKGQETEVFKKFHQKTLEKSSFSVVYGHDYKTLDVAAKSIDECDMWVRCISKLVELYRKKQDITKLKTMDVGIKFKDRNRPKSRQGAGNFVRANNSKNLKIDPVALKEIEKEMDSLHKTYHKVAQLCTKSAITKSKEYENIKYVLSELEERMEELTYEIANIRDTELAKREVWRANVDLTAIQEKVEVLIKQASPGSIMKRASAFF